MVRIQTYVTINGIDVSSKVLKWQFSDTFGNEIPDLKLTLGYSALTSVTIANGQEVIVKRGPTTGQEYNVFKGNVDTINKRKPFVEVKCKDKLIALVHTIVNTSFDKDIDAEAGKGSEIVNTLITTHGGLSTNSGATVQDTGAVIVLDKFVCRKTDVFERILAIADIYDYQIYYNYDDDYVYFEPTGYSSNANALTVGSNVYEIPKWEYDNSQLINNIRVDGAESLVETNEEQPIAGAGDYNQTDFLLAQSPFSVKVFVGVASPPAVADIKVGGAIDSTGTFDYSVDEQNKKIVWNTSQYTPTIGHNCLVQYSYPAPIPIIRKRQTSIDAYGESATIKHFSDVRTVEDAINRGNLFLDTYAEPFVRVQLKISNIDNDYRAGEKVRIVDTYNEEDRELVINKIIRSWPHKHDILHCGNREYAIAEYNKLTLDKIKRLEEELSKNDDILISVIDVDRTFKPRRRYMKLQKQSIAGDTLIWGHPTYGIWNEFKWGNTAQVSFVLGHPSYGLLGTSQLGSQASSPVTVKLVQGNMTYDEYAYDTEFHDAVNSTATFSTVTQDIIFTSGQIWYSNVIDLGTTLSWVTVDLGDTVGTLVIEISSDNKSTWQTITEGVRTAVSSSDGLGTYIRITATDADAIDLFGAGGIGFPIIFGAGYIGNTLDSYGQNSAPLVKVLMEE